METGTTKYGLVKLLATQADHIYVNGEEMKVNGAEVAANAHYHLWNDQQWHLGPQFNNDGRPKGAWEAKHYFYARRGFCGTISESATNKIIAEYDKVVNEWASSHPEAIAKAAYDYAGKEIEKNNEEIKNLLQKVDEKTKEIQNLVAYRSRLKDIYLLSE